MVEAASTSLTVPPAAVEHVLAQGIEELALPPARLLHQLLEHVLDPGCPPASQVPDPITCLEQDAVS